MAQVLGSSSSYSYFLTRAKPILSVSHRIACSFGIHLCMCNGSQACGGSEARQRFHSRRTGFVTTVIRIVAVWRFGISVTKQVNSIDKCERDGSGCFSPMSQISSISGSRGWMAATKTKESEEGISSRTYFIEIRSRWMVCASEIKHFRSSDGNARSVPGISRRSKTSDAGIKKRIGPQQCWFQRISMKQAWKHQYSQQTRMAGLKHGCGTCFNSPKLLSCFAVQCLL